ncbi:cupin-like domain-containing protein [Proteobacteria bacterium 005FR1]|nr:cupin-like domain-containing protein [Proteobacteria bacterium 005FR1]
MREITGCSPRNIPESVLGSEEPLVLRGLVAEWPAVKLAKSDLEKADAYVRAFYNGRPVTAYFAPPEADGRIFYNEDFSGFCFSSGQVQLCEVLDRLLNLIASPRPPTIYVGSTMLDNWLPGFREQNDIIIDGMNPLASIWIGNRSRIAAHYDFPDNIACVVAGRRRFTLFPPEQVENLYVGPLDLTPSGQQISLVDFQSPDFEKHPRFAQALEAARTVELDPGDALFIPSMWWHYVESLADYNILVNYWWRRSPAYLGTPLNALEHALLSIRALPEEQRRAWQALFNYYVFEADEKTHAHIPEHARGLLGHLDERAARQLRAQLLNKLNR